MKELLRFCALLIALTMVLPGASLAEEEPEGPVAVVTYDHASLSDWTPGYRLTLPGTLLELTRTEGRLSVSVVEVGGMSTGEYLSEQLDRAGETLAVSDASIVSWDDPFEGDGLCLSFTYTYPEGDEYHLTRIWTATGADDRLIELSVDVWGVESDALMAEATSAFIDGGFTIHRFDQSDEIIATISDLRQGENGLTELQLTPPSIAYAPDASFYPLSPDTVILFPNPDDPTLFLPVSPDMASLVDALLTYEENSDGPASFRTILNNGQIVYMEYAPRL